MRSGTKNLILVAASTTLSAVLFAALYEGYEHYRYRQWKAEFENSRQWYGGLTIPSPNPVLLWEYRANGKYTRSDDPKFAFTIITNRYGFRDRDYPVRKPAGVFRVAYIGDSLTLGFKVESDQTFVSQVRNAVNARNPGAALEAMNFGIDGYNTIQVHELLRTKVVDFQPDRVVYVMSLNDFDFADASGQKIRFFKPPASFLLQRIEQVRRRMSPQNYYEYHFRKNKEEVFEQIKAMKHLLDARRIDFQVAIAPVFEDPELGFSSYRFAFIHEEIARQVTAAGIPAIDLLESFKKLDLPQGAYALDQWHPNEIGHRVIAEGLSRTAWPPGDGAPDRALAPVREDTR